MASPQIAVQITGKNDLNAVLAQSTKQLDGFRKQSERTQNDLRRMTNTRGITDLNKGFKEATRSSFEFFKNLSRSVDSMGVLTGAGSLAGLAALSGSIASIGQAQLNSARGLNMGVKQLATWGNAAAAAGSSADSATASIAGLEKARTEMTKMNSSAMGPANQLLGKGWQDKYKDDQSLLMAISSAISKLHGAAKAKALSQAEEAFHLSPDFAQDFLLRGPAYVQKALAEAAKHSMDGGQAANLDGLATGFTNLGQSIKQAGVDAASNIAPKLTPALNSLSTWIDAHQKAVGDFALTIGSLGTGLAALKVAKLILPSGKSAAAGGAGFNAAECCCGGGRGSGVPGEGKPGAFGSGLYSLFLMGPAGLILNALTNGLPDGADTANLHRQFPGLSGTPGVPDRGPSWWDQDAVTNFKNKVLGLEGRPGVLFPAIEAEVRKDAKKYGIDPDRAVAQFRVEGGGYSITNPKTGAFGPSQLMPATAASLGVATSVNDPNYDWRANVDAGIRYQAQMQKQFGNQDAALAAYNWGPGNVQNWDGKLNDMPAQTRNYIATIDGITGASAVAPVSGVKQTDPVMFDTQTPSSGPVTAADRLAFIKAHENDDDRDGEFHVYFHAPPGAKVTTKQTGTSRVKTKTVTSMPDAHVGMYESAIDGKWHNL